MTGYDYALGVTLGAEGGYTSNPADPGNWTGGRVGAGICRGTKFGISAKAFPTLDIKALTLKGAGAIYRPNFWDKVSGDKLPLPLAVLTFDAAVNSGPDRAARWLQAALRVPVDGDIGSITIKAAQAAAGQGAAVLAEFQAQRLLFLTALPTWRVFGLGWTRRICTIQIAALAAPTGAI